MSVSSVQRLRKVDPAIVALIAAVTRRADALSLAVLKLIAWQDRQENMVRRKHVEDIHAILTNFAVMFPQKAATVDDWSEMPDDELEIAAFLLGR